MVLLTNKKGALAPFLLPKASDIAIIDD